MSDILKNRIKNRLNIGESIFTQTPPFPQKNMLIELTNACNDACIFCCNRKMTRKKGNIDPKFLERILNEAYELGTREVGFYTTGEPLLCVNLKEYVALAKKIGYTYVYITTNGALATPNKINPVIDAGLDSIKFSINALNEDDYHFIHGKNDFDLVISNLKSVYEYKKKNNLNLNVFVSYVKTRYTNRSQQEIEGIFLKYCDEVDCVAVRDQYGSNPLVNDILSIVNEPDIIKLPCHLLFNSISITWEGYISCCCTDFQNYLVYADLNKISLKEAWNCELIKKFRQAHINGNVCDTMCENCVSHIYKEVKPLRHDLCTPINFEVMFRDNEFLDRIAKFNTHKG